MRWVVAQRDHSTALGDWAIPGVFLIDEWRSSLMEQATLREDNVVDDESLVGDTKKCTRIEVPLHFFPNLRSQRTYQVHACQMISPLNTKPTPMRKLSYRPGYGKPARLKTTRNAAATTLAQRAAG